MCDIGNRSYSHNMFKVWSIHSTVCKLVAACPILASATDPSKMAPAEIMTPELTNKDANTVDIVTVTPGASECRH